MRHNTVGIYSYLLGLKGTPDCGEALKALKALNFKAVNLDRLTAFSLSFGSLKPTGQRALSSEERNIKEKYPEVTAPSSKVLEDIQSLTGKVNMPSVGDYESVGLVKANFFS